MVYHQLGNADVAIVTLGAHFRLEFRTVRVFQVVHKQSCHKFLVILLLKRDCKVRHCLHGVHRRVAMTHSPGHLVSKLSQLHPFSLANFPLFLQENKIKLNVLLNPFYLALYEQVSHHLQTITFV